MAWVLALPENYLIGMLLWLAAGGIALWAVLKWRRRRRRKNRKLTPANFFLSVWLLLAMLTAVELYFALLFDATDSFNRSNVSQVWFRRHLKPEQRTLDWGEAGVNYRDDEPIPLPIPEDKKHILFVGDSFTFGHGVAKASDRFSNRVRAELSERFPGEYLVTNLSEPGTDLNWSFALTKELVKNEIRVDTLVYVFCPNDIEVYHPDHMEHVHELGELEPDCPLIRETFFPNLLYYRIKLASVPAARDYYGYLADYYTGEPWVGMRNQFKEFADFSKAHQIELRVVIFPFLQDLEGESPFDTARKVVREFCQEEGIPVLDLYDTLHKHADEDLTVSLFDAHPNSRAHQLAAEAILPFLLRKVAKLPPGRLPGSARHEEN